MKQKIPKYAYVAVIAAVVVIAAIFFFAEPKEPANLAGEAFRFNQKQFEPAQKVESKYQYEIKAEEKDPLKIEDNKQFEANQGGVIENNPSVTCTDTDGGVDRTIQGTVFITSNGQTVATETDECNGNTLTEFYCAGSPGNEYSTKQFIPCLGATCSNGACVTVMNNSHHFAAYSVQGSGLYQAEIRYSGQTIQLGGTRSLSQTLPTGERFTLMGATNSSVDFFFENVCTNVDRANITVTSNSQPAEYSFFQNIARRGSVTGTNAMGTLNTGENVRTGRAFYQQFAGGLVGGDFTITCN